MFEFYKSNIDYLKLHSVDPDKRRYGVKEEGPRHYIDLDHYFENEDVPFELRKFFKIIPERYEEAKLRYTEDTLEAYGLLPWHLNLMMLQLTMAFKEAENDKILKLSAEIGHYAADAHVPLHTTENYNGQLTGQYGIHALWESRIPEKFSKSYLFLNGNAEFIEDVQRSIWEIVLESHSKVNYVLKTEFELRSTFPSDKIYRPSTVGKGVKKQFTSAYVDAYEKSNGDLVEDKIKKAAHYAASLWYTAWVNAGQPNLKSTNH